MVYDGRAVGRWDVGRSPHGERGLKYFADLRYCRWILSLPTRGAWIEMEENLPTILRGECRSPHGERGLKCDIRKDHAKVIKSLPTRGAWIEILIFLICLRSCMVAPHTGSVD